MKGPDTLSSESKLYYFSNDDWFYISFDASILGVLKNKHNGPSQ